MGMKILIYDKSEKTFVGLSWKVGSFFFGTFLRYFDHVCGASSWEDAFEWIEKTCEKTGKPIKELQYWGHGLPGVPILNKHPLPIGLFLHIQKSIMPSTLIWFRCCAVFNGEQGHDFAKSISNFVKCRIAAHTFNIGFPYHSGLHTIAPGFKPYWPTNEGLDKKGDVLGSSHAAPNTIFTLSNKFSDRW